MKFVDFLTKEQIREFNKLRHSSKNYKEELKGHRPHFVIYDEMHDQPKSKKEKLSHKDIEELMGTRRDVYTRHRGAVRRR